MTTISLIPGAFNDELLHITSSVKTRWSGEDHDQFVDTLLSRLVDKNNQAVVLDDKLKDDLKLIFRPTDERQRNGLKRAFAEAGYELSDTDVDAFAVLFNVAQFSSFLATKDPTTQISLITKPKRVGKKNTLKALLAQKPVVPNPEPAPSAAPASDENADGDENEVEPVPVAPAQVNPKKSAAPK